MDESTETTDHRITPDRSRAIQREFFANSVRLAIFKEQLRAGKTPIDWVGFFESIKANPAQKKSA